MSVREATVGEVHRFFEKQDRRVLTFIGYSGAGHEDEQALLEETGRILDGFDPSETIVNSGATRVGIGAVYEVAKSRGFVTTGIVSTQARESGAELSPFVDHVFFVPDEKWGGFLEGGDVLSPTSTAMVENSEVLVGIGGGEVGRDELLAARRHGKEVRFIPADMNHRRAMDRAAERGLPEPTDFAGAAAEAFRQPES